MNNIIKRVWNQNRLVNIEDLTGMVFQAEAGGHTFEISGIDDDGNPVALSGTVYGVFRRPDNADIALTGSTSDGVVSVTLSEDCYAVPGRFGLTIFVTSNSQKVAVYACVGTVAVSSTGNVAGDTPASVEDLIDDINAAIADLNTAIGSIPADYSQFMAAIAPAYSSSALYAVGSYAWHDGSLYRCITAITTAETWTAAHWTAAVLGDDVGDLKSEIDSKQVEIDDFHYLVPFNYETDYNLQAGNDYSSATYVGFKRERNYIKLNTIVTGNKVVRIKIDGTPNRTQSNAGVDSWAGITLTSGHRYRLSALYVGGESNQPVPNTLVVYEEGTHSSLGTGWNDEKGNYYRDFIYNSTPVNLALYIYSGSTYNDYKIVVILQDLTLSEQEYGQFKILSSADFVEGSLNAQGQESVTPGAGRIRTYFIDLEDANVSVQVNGQKIAYCLYDSSMTFLINTGWIYSDFDVAKTGDARYVRFVVANSDDSALVPAGLLATIAYSNKTSAFAYEGDQRSEGFTKSPYTQTLDVVMHRGYNRVAPENTIPAFKLARKMGFSTIEIDIQLTSDGVPVVLHDGTVNRTSNGTGNIFDMTLAQAKALDFGSWKSSMWSGTKIPTFEEMLVLCKKIGLDVYIEIKRESPWTQELITECVEMVRNRGMRNHVRWISFSDTLLRYVQTADSKARLGYLMTTYTTEAVDTCISLATDENDVWAVTKYDLLSASVLSYMQERNVPLCVYIIDSNSDADSIQDYAVSVLTNEFNVSKYIYEKII